MNFFEQQDKARKRTSILLFFYALAVIATIISVYGVARFSWYLFRWSGGGRSYDPGGLYVPFQFWDPQFFLITTGIVCAIVLLGTLLKIAELSSGGKAVAKMLGGEQILPNTVDPDERKVLNVVEEMSIASGAPVPAVFLLKNEYAINAFAAGFSMRDAVIGVTQGTVKLLSRDELQGVIAHEFSHIFNGDMCLNMHLTGFLNGLLLIALTGKGILRGFGRGRIRASGRGGAGLLVIMLFAVLLVVVGYIGVFFCNWIKSCVSRQREFLADASSAQYTRNPGGLAGALKKIGGLGDGSFIRQVKAEEISHFFFADGLGLVGRMFFSTHPPLGFRIKLLDPSFDGNFPAVKSAAPPGLASKYQARKPAFQSEAKAKEWERKMAVFRVPLAVTAQASLADSVVSTVGTATNENLGQAVRMLEGFPKPLKIATMTLSGSAALVYGLLIDRFNSQTRARQIEYLSQRADPAVHQFFLKLLPDFSSLPVELCLPLLDLATPALKTQSPVMYDLFRKNIEALINMDQTVTVFEFALKQVVLHHLDFFFGKIKKPEPVFASLEQVLESCEVLLSYLAGVGHLSQPLAATSFMKAAKGLAPSREWKFIPAQALVQKQAEEALASMSRAFPRVKEQFLKACVNCVQHDGRLDIREMELLRAFASTLDCPIPPLSVAV